jgi:hypothetical protein
MRFLIEFGGVLAFARAIGDERCAEMLEAGAREEPLPPTFVVASAQVDPDYPRRPKAGAPWPRAEPLASAGPGLSYLAEYSIEYVRPLRIGDELEVARYAGREWTKSGRSGRLHFHETITEYRDAGGHLVATARDVGVRVAPGEGAEG